MYGLEETILLFQCPSISIRSRVCARNTLRIPLAYNETYAKPQHHPYLTLCPGPRVCSTYRLMNMLGALKVWIHAVSLPFSFLPLATCHKSCQNGGSCIQPNKCQCPPGWGGRYCQIVQTLGIQETIPNEIQELQAKVEQLEEVSPIL
ncbi:hypothetical protein Chor_011617 [Crotalus horridus]